LAVEPLEANENNRKSATGGAALGLVPPANEARPKLRNRQLDRGGLLAGEELAHAFVVVPKPGQGFPSRRGVQAIQRLANHQPAVVR
jgi:hypothetical protein